LVLVHGDTASALACALAAFYEGIAVGHVEAGLRTYDPSAPFPEEMNRQIIGRLSSLDFPPTERARESLLREGKPSARVIVTGNTVADALAFTVKTSFEHPLLRQTEGHPLVLFTCHRRENRERMGGLFLALHRVATAFPDHRFLFPVHPAPLVREAACGALLGVANVILTDPLDVVALHNLLARCEMVVTDSGGLQEEALTLHKPVAVLREVTERPEGLFTGGAVLLGTHPEAVETGLRRLLAHPETLRKKAALPSPYGEAGACGIIADEVIRFLS
jgi:UDP-N-acetylglucosamine 2-epimerase (non-hydrolysing)